MILVTGASGYIGQRLLELAAADPGLFAGETLLPAWRSKPMDGVQLDLTDADAVEKVFSSHPISAVIHLAAEARTAECEKEPELARLGNIVATSNLVNACNKGLPYLLHASTDMVFRGDNAPYAEDAAPDATGVYGKSKVAAEQLITSYKGPRCIFRPALVYGPPAGSRVSSLASTMGAVKSGAGSFFTDEIRTPVLVDDLVRLVSVLYKIRHEGIVNAGGPERMSRFDYAVKVANAWKIPVTNVQAGSLSSNPDFDWRPKDISLKSDQAHRLVTFTPMDDALRVIRQNESL